MCFSPTFYRDALSILLLKVVLPFFGVVILSLLGFKGGHFKI